MIKYLLYVTIDTNIFYSTGYDLGQNGTLGHLYSYVQSGKIKIDEVLPEEEVIDLCDVDCMDFVASELIE